MGTFRLNPNTVVSFDGVSQAAPFGWCFSNLVLPATSVTDGLAVDDNTAFTYVLDAPHAATNAHIRFNIDATKIFLDGSSTPTDINDLPAGFTPLTLVLKKGNADLINAGDFIFVSFDALTESDGSETQALSFDYPTTPVPTIQNIIINGFGWRCAFVIDSTSELAADASAFFLEGTYVANSFHWTLQTPTTPLKSGDTVIVSVPSGDPEALDPTKIQTASFSYRLIPGGPITTVNIPSTDWSLVNTEFFDFTLPDISGDKPTVLEFFITSTQFTGSVSLGRLTTIYFQNAPGIYKIVSGKTNDTLYDVINGGTIDVKIPNPFAKTGFVGG